jgi:ribulose-phosphate 3-epimerase
MIDRSGRDIDLEVDGGINTHTAQKTIEAGADVLVAGTAVFKERLGGYRENITKLRGI